MGISLGSHATTSAMEATLGAQTLNLTPSTDTLAPRSNVHVFLSLFDITSKNLCSDPRFLEEGPIWATNQAQEAGSDQIYRDD